MPAILRLDELPISWITKAQYRAAQVIAFNAEERIHTDADASSLAPFMGFGFRVSRFGRGGFQLGFGFQVSESVGYKLGFGFRIVRVTSRVGFRVSG